MKDPLIVCNMRYEKLCDLHDDSGYQARRITETIGLNSIPQLSFELPIDNPKSQYIINENIILYRGEYYRIKTPTIAHEENGNKKLTVNCSHLSETLQTNIISISETTPRIVTDLMKLALAYSNGNPTLGWKVGNVTVNTTAKRGLERSEQSAFSHLCVIAEKYDGILVFNSQTKTVDLKPRIENARSDFELSIHKNLKGVTITYDTSEMVTRLYCYGGNDSNGNEINIMSVNPTRFPYVENYDYFYTLGYTPTDINNSPELFIKTNIWRDTNYYLPFDLYNDGIKELEKRAKPKIDVQIQALDISDYNVNLELGDAINVTDEDLGISFVCNLISKTIDYDNPHVLNIEVTNQVNYKDILSEMFTKVSTASQVVTSGGIVKGSKVDGINTNQVRDLSVKYASIEYLLANYIDVTNLAAQYANINHLEANYANIEQLQAEYATIENLVANYLKVTDANIKYATIDELTANYLKVADAIIKYATIEHLQANYIDATTIETDYLKVTDADIEYAKITNLEAEYATINELQTYYLKASDAAITYATIEHLIANYMTVENADIKYATIEDLRAKYATIEYLQANYLLANSANLTYAKITDLEASNANIGTLTTNVANIESLLGGNVVSGNVQSINLTALNTTIENAMIKNAMIDSVSVDKLLAGDISTNKFNVKSDSGNLVIADNTIQIKDGTKVRVQIGKDASDDYNMYVWDTDGRLMFDATGIHEDAIKSAIIRDDMVSPTANIDAGKLDIASLFEVINNDGTHTLKGSKIAIDTQGQTLDIVFNSLTSNLTEIEQALHDKRRVFTNIPIPPYNVGDLWVKENGELLVCNVAREEVIPIGATYGELQSYTHQHLGMYTHEQIATNKYILSDWTKAVKYTDDATANEALVKTETNTTQINIANGKINTIITETELTKLQNGETTFYDQFSGVKQTIDEYEVALANSDTTMSDLLNEVKTNSAKISATPEQIKQTVTGTYILENVQPAINEGVSSANEYADNRTNSISETFQTAITQTKSNVLTTLEQSMTDLDANITQKYKTELDATAQAYEMRFSDINNAITESSANLGNMNQYFNFSTNGLEIGKSGSPLKINIDNDQMDFKDGEAIVAYVNGQKMYISNLDVVDSLEVGNHKIEKFNNEITLIRFIG